MANKTLIMLATAILATLGVTVFLYNQDGGQLFLQGQQETDKDGNLICEKGEFPYYDECRKCSRSQYGAWGFGSRQYQHWVCLNCRRGNRCDGKNQMQCRKGQYGTGGECYNCPTNQYGEYDYGDENYRHWLCRQCPRGYTCNGRDKRKINE